jgi:hypothetical protein
MTKPAPDYDEIVRVVQLYVDGFAGDVEKFRRAFHESAWIYYTDEQGELHKWLLVEGFERWAASHRKIKGRIISVTQAGDLAVVLLGFDEPADPKETWVDAHTLLRLNGVWKIMAKTATHSSRAAWAAP